jgi:hypothetical protein
MTETLQPMADEVDPQQLAQQLLAQAKAQGDWAVSRILDSS